MEDIMFDSPMLFDAWLWLAIVAKWWLIASVCLLLFLVATQRRDKPSRNRTRPPGSPGFGGGMRLSG